VEPQREQCNAGRAALNWLTNPAFDVPLINCYLETPGDSSKYHGGMTPGEVTSPIWTRGPALLAGALVIALLTVAIVWVSILREPAGPNGDALGRQIELRQKSRANMD